MKENIRMTDGLGLDLLDKVRSYDFKVIFISAHQQYASRALSYSSVSYLLKPVDPDELMQAVERAEAELGA